MRKFIILVLCALCLAGMFTSCKKKDGLSKAEIKTVETAPFKTVRTVYGPKGANRKFFWDIVKADGSIDSFEVRTNEKNVGKALSSVALAKFTEDYEGKITDISISGYNLDEGMKWVFYVNGEISESDPNNTEIKSGTVYSFRQVKD